ncbi:MAG: branched-chain-amino-acid transaminase [Flavobacteriaceae bacterium]|nr:branched-chain-amino-acid transaminase [Bacteroidia bacterium]NNF75457.1 branched-chain-amino-acid transaminase [Flavobacteriaceae bacterium]
MYYNENSFICLNGKFVKANDSHGSLYSQTLHYGNGVFEGIRSYKTDAGTKIFRAEEHYQRLLFGADVMSIPFEYNTTALIDLSYKLLELNNLTDAYIRPIITTPPSMGLLTPDRSDLIIQCWYWDKLMGDGLVKVMTSSYQRPNPKSCVVEAKVTGHYVNSILAKNEAKKAGFKEALLLDMNGNVAECSGANIFMEKDGVLYTPPKGHIMAGITRSVVMEICKDEGIQVEERFFNLEELKRADSAFVTGTAAEVAGLASLDDYNFPLNWTDSLGKRLSDLYQLEVLGKRSKHVSKVL